MMGSIQINLPESVHQNLKKLAHKDRVSIDQFVISAVSEKISAFLTREYLEERAARASKQKFMDVLAKVPDTEPEAYDRL